MFTVATRFYEACANKRFDPGWFGNHNVRIFTGDGSDPKEKPGIAISAQPYTHLKLHTQALNLMFAALGSMASAVYEAAATDTGLRDPNKAPADYDDTEKIIEIVYQIRNGFAHRPHAPNWRVNPARQNHYSLTVEAVEIDIDFSVLHEQAIAPEHFGGFEGFIAMCRHLHTVVKAMGTAVPRRPA